MGALAGIVCAAILTLVVAIFWLSFVNGAPGAQPLSYTMRHYSEVLSQAFTYRVLANTLLFSAVALTVALGFALPIAWLAERTNLPGKSLVFTLMTISLIVPGFAVALGWLFLLHPRIGLINLLLIDQFHLASAPFNIASIAGMGMIEGLALAPVAFIMMAAAMRSMDPTLEEAAAISGATLGRTLLRVTLPVLWPALLATSIYVFTIGFSSFDVPAIIGMSNRIFTFATNVYFQLSPWAGVPTYGNVAVLSVVMVTIAGALSFVYSRVQNQGLRYAVLTGKAFRPQLIQLRRAKIPAIAFIAIYFVVAELLPILMLIWASGLPFLQIPSAAAFAQLSFAHFTVVRPLLWSGLSNTLSLMVLVPTITLVFCVAISWVVMRSRLPGRAIFDFLAFLPHCVPAIALSVAALLLVLYVLNNIIPLYGSIWLLVAVYVVARVSYGTRLTNIAFVQIHRDLDESAQISGATTLGTMRSIFLPLLLPSILYTWAWIALLSYRELTLPVLLSTASNKPLSVVVWSFLETSSYGDASALTVVMLGLLSPLLLVYWIFARRAGIVVPHSSA